MIPAVAGAAAVAGLADFGSSIIGNIGSKSRMKYAYKKNLEFWNLQNEYNSPTAQRERLAEAGLNPNLIYGGSPSSATGNADSIAPVKPAPYQAPNLGAGVNAYFNYKLQKAQTDNLETQATVNRQEALIRQSEAFRRRNQQLEEQYSLGAKTGDKDVPSYFKDLAKYSLEAQKQNVRLLEAQGFGRELENSRFSAATQDVLLKLHYDALNAKETLTGTKLVNELRRLEKQLNELGLQKGDPWYAKVIGQAVMQYNYNHR